MALVAGIVHFFRRIYQRLNGRNTERLTEKARRGRLAEEAAVRFLERERGLRVLVRNWRRGPHEIDLVCLDYPDGLPQVVFVEVRARSSQAKISGYRSIGRRKKHALRKAIRSYLQSVRPRPVRWRLDVVETELAGDVIVRQTHLVQVDLEG